jgi:hypothetical protein
VTAAIGEGMTLQRSNGFAMSGRSLSRIGAAATPVVTSTATSGTIRRHLKDGYVVIRNSC